RPVQPRGAGRTRVRRIPAAWPLDEEQHPVIARLPSFRLTGFLLLVWLLLTESIAFGNVLLGLAFALLFAALARPFMPIPVRVRRSAALGRLLANALVEVVRSCLNVTRVILSGRYE